MGDGDEFDHERADRDALAKLNDLEGDMGAPGSPSRRASTSPAAKRVI